MVRLQVELTRVHDDQRASRLVANARERRQHRPSTLAGERVDAQPRFAQGGPDRPPSAADHHVDAIAEAWLEELLENQGGQAPIVGRRVGNQRGLTLAAKSVERVRETGRHFPS